MALESQGIAFLWSTSTSTPTTAQTSAVTGKVMGFNGPTGSANIIDITALDSTAKEKLVGLRDEGQISLDLLYLTTDQAQIGMRTDRANRSKRAWALALTDASSSLISGKGYCSGFAITGSVDDAVKLSVTIEIDGAVTFTTR